MGLEEGRRIIDESDPLLLVIGLPVIPIGLILAKLIKWEDFILRLWRQGTFNFSRPISYIIEEPPAQPRANCDQILLDPGFAEPQSCTRMICGALLLPTVSALVGKLLFSRFSGSQWRRSLFGGLAFLLLKGALKIYLRKSLYVRYSHRTIKNYVPSVQSKYQQTRSSVGSSSSLDGTGNMPTSSNNNEQATEESDNQLIRPPRIMFSINYRF